MEGQTRHEFSQDAETQPEPANTGLNMLFGSDEAAPLESRI